MPPIILIVDDEKLLRGILRSFFRKALKNNEFDFIFAFDGIEALEKLEEYPEIDLVITDIKMPRMDGLTLLSKMNDLDRALHCIVMTAHTDMKSIRAAMNRGAFDFLVKPLDFQDVEITIRQTLAKIQQLKRGLQEKKRLEKEKIRLFTAIEQSSESIFITDVHGTIQYVNPTFEKVTGYSSKEIIGQNPRVLNSGLQDPNFYQSMWKTLLNGEIWSGNIINRSKEGHLIEEKLSISPVRDDQGIIVSYVAVKRDITHEMRLERQLRQSQKMEAIGTLAGGIAHDFNNILFAMLGYMSMAQANLTPDHPSFDDLQEATLAGTRAHELVRQILTFSRQEESQFQSVEFVSLTKEVLKFLRYSIPTTVEIQSKLPNEKLNLLADPTQIHQIVVNLCTNAFQAMESSNGLLKVSLEQVEIDSLFAFQHSLTEETYAKLAISDTGEGMDSETQERIFDPFFTTKSVGKGTGLGLSVVHGIIKNHKGTIIVKSQLGKGSTFTVYLPLVKKDFFSSRSLPSIGNNGYQLGEGRLLVVDDEGALVKLEKQVLERCGYEVIATNDSIEALELFQADPYSFDLVITDQTMPKLTGLQLAKKIRLIHPKIPIILISGYLQNADSQEFKEIGIQKSLTKPVKPSELSKYIHQILNKKTE